MIELTIYKYKNLVFLIIFFKFIYQWIVWGKNANKFLQVLIYTYNQEKISIDFNKTLKWSQYSIYMQLSWEFYFVKRLYLKEYKYLNDDKGIRLNVKV